MMRKSEEKPWIGLNADWQAHLSVGQWMRTPMNMKRRDVLPKLLSYKTLDFETRRKEGFMIIYRMT